MLRIILIILWDWICSQHKRKVKPIKVVRTLLCAHCSTSMVSKLLNTNVFYSIHLHVPENKNWKKIYSKTKQKHKLVELELLQIRRILLLDRHRPKVEPIKTECNKTVTLLKCHRIMNNCLQWWTLVSYMLIYLLMHNGITKGRKNIRWWNLPTHFDYAFIWYELFTYR